MNSNTGSDPSDERAFLHDLASPLGVALLQADVLRRVLVPPYSTDKAATAPAILKQVCEALETARDLLNKRRNTLIARGVPSSAPRDQR